MTLNILIILYIFMLIVSFVVTYLFSKIGLKYGLTGKDSFKKEHPNVSTLGGYSLIISTVIGLSLLFLLNIINIKFYISSLLSLIILGGIGIIDDYIPDLPGYFKPLGAFIAGLPIVLFHAYKSTLIMFGEIGFHLPIVYPLLILIAFSVVPNSVNMLDVINGSAVTGVIFVLLAASISCYIRFNGLAIISILFIMILVGFLILNFYPARIFLGNTGSLLLGYYILISAIFYRVEFPSLIAMFPFIHNSFFYLNKVKSFIEHKKLSVRVTYFDEKDELIYDACDDEAPLTLLRFIVANNPKTEFESYICMLVVFVVAFLLSIFTVLVWG